MPIDELPFYPDVTIHWRCSDNLFFTHMGLVPYRFIVDRIPADAKYVFIVTEASYGQGHTRQSRSSGLCVPIIDGLVAQIRGRAPHAHVVVRAGGGGDSLFVTIAMLVHSPIAFCSSSTFCYHFSVIRTSGKLYLPTDAGYFYGVNLNCCGGVVETMMDSYSITDWVSEGHHLVEPDDREQPDIVSDRAVAMVTILSDKDYIACCSMAAFPEAFTPLVDIIYDLPKNLLCRKESGYSPQMLNIASNLCGSG